LRQHSVVRKEPLKKQIEKRISEKKERTRGRFLIHRQVVAVGNKDGETSGIHEELKDWVLGAEGIIDFKGTQKKISS